LAAALVQRLGAKVTVLEKDRLEGARPGTPQAPHLHVLKPAGVEALENLLPGIKSELLDRGAHRATFPDAFALNVGGTWGHPPSTGGSTETLLLTRALLEAAVRARVASIDAVQVRDGRSVLGLKGSGGAVAAVRHRAVGVGPGREVEESRASLVIDCTGRGSRFPKWMEAIGGSPPEQESFDIRCLEATALVRPRREFTRERSPGITKVECGVGLNEPRRYAMMMSVEDGLWQVCLSGWGGERPPLDWATDWRTFAASLPDGVVADALHGSELVRAPVLAAATANVRWRWDALERSPAGFVAFGDAACAPNPMWGQGVTMAAVEALALAEALAGEAEALERARAGLLPLEADACAAAQRAVARAAQPFWDVAVGGDGARLDAASL